MTIAHGYTVLKHKRKNTAAKDKEKYIYIYMNTYIHTRIHTYIHTYRVAQNKIPH